MRRRSKPKPFAVVDIECDELTTELHDTYEEALESSWLTSR